MFVELLDRLRCPNDHADSPLVATASRTVARHIVEGALGCPVCHAEYAVHGGAVDFGAARRPPAPHPAVPPAEATPGATTLRLGALLGLDDRGGVYVLEAGAARCIPGLAELSPASQFIAVTDDAPPGGAGLVIRGCGAVLPLAKACARGIALEETAPERLRSAVDALAPGGRLVAPARAAIPDGIGVLARDEEQWVGERAPVPALSAIRRAPRR